MFLHSSTKSTACLRTLQYGKGPPLLCYPRGFAERYTWWSRKKTINYSLLFTTIASSSHSDSLLIAHHARLEVLCPCMPFWPARGH